MSPRTHVVRLWVDTDRWRYRCREGHPSWRPSGNQFYCQGCSRDPTVDSPMYETLLDQQTDEVVTREMLDLRTRDSTGNSEGH